MNLSAPTKVMFLVSFVIVVLAVVALLGISIPLVSGNAAWTAVIGYVVLAAGNLMKGV